MPQSMVPRSVGRSDAVRDFISSKPGSVREGNKTWITRNHLREQIQYQSTSETKLYVFIWWRSLMKVLTLSIHLLYSKDNQVHVQIQRNDTKLMHLYKFFVFLENRKDWYWQFQSLSENPWVSLKSLKLIRTDYPPQNQRKEITTLCSSYNVILLRVTKSQN